MRDLHVDSLKGFLILAVVWGHIGLVRAAVPGDIATWIPLEELINRQIPVNYFHMALFFAVSILFVKGISFEFIKKRALLLLVPYLFWYLWPIQNSLIMDSTITFKNLLLGNWSQVGDSTLIFKNLLWGNWPHVRSILWFLPACFAVNVYFAIYRKYSQTYWAVAFWLLWLGVFFSAEPIAALYHSRVPFGIDLAIYLFPLLFVVDYVYRHKDWLKKISAWWALFLLPVAYGCIKLIDWIEPIKTYTAFAYRVDLAQFTVPFTVVGLLAMLGLCSSITLFFLMVKPLGVLSLVGKYSLPIYLLHLLIISKWAMAVNQVTIWQQPSYYFVMMVLAIPVVVATAIGASKLLSKLSPYAKYLGMVP